MHKKKRTHIAKKRTGRNIPVPLEPEEYKRLIKKPNKRYPTGLRNLCMIRLMGECGLRSNETVILAHKDINWKNGQIKVLGKGKKERIVFANGELLHLLLKWDNIRPTTANTPFFCTMKGDTKAVTNHYVRKMVKRYAVKAKIETDVHPHTLRHTFATQFLKKTKDLRALQIILGHAHISTTEIYTHLTNEDVQNYMTGFRIE